MKDIAAYMPELTQNIAHLVHFDTVQQPPQPDVPFGLPLHQALDFVLGLAQNWGWRTCNLDYKCGWAEVGEGPLFGVLGHIDVVPLGEGWHYPPLGATIADGKMYGRGTQDDKGPLLSSMYALKALLDEGEKPRMRVRFIIGCNEETEWECMERYLATEEIPAMSISPDGDFPVINCEKGLGHFEITLPVPSWLLQFDSGTRVNMVPDRATCLVPGISDQLAQMARNWGVTVTTEGDKVRLSASGRSAHGSTPWLGDNAFLKILHVLSYGESIFGILDTYFADPHGANCGLGFEDVASGKLSMNVGYAHLVDDMLHIGLDIRYPISVDNDKVYAALCSAFSFGKVDIMHSHPSLYVPADHPLVVALLDAYQAVTGTRPAPLCIGGATYARALPNAVAFGPVFPGDEEMCHQVDEYLRLDRLQQMTAIYREAFARLCFGPTPQ